MNLDKDAESWAKVHPEAVLSGSQVQRVNVLTMAKHDIAILSAEVRRLHAETCRLSGGLIAITNAPKTVGSSVLRSIAYDIALNCIKPDVAEYQIKRRSGITGPGNGD